MGSEFPAKLEKGNLNEYSPQLTEGSIFVTPFAQVIKNIRLFFVGIIESYIRWIVWDVIIYILQILHIFCLTKPI
jgi:hypothetical protein